MQSFESRARTSKILLAACAALSLAACGGDEESSASQAPSGKPPAGNPPAGSGAPVVTGAPLSSTLFGRQYSYTPSVVDPDGDPLTFSIDAVPTWATFDTATGRLHGTPTAGDVGITRSMTISVSDGARTSTIGPFSINVVATASGAATLSWAPPTQNSDGSPLTNLSAYRVYFGTSQDDLTNSLTVTNPGIATVVVEQLTPATWYFGVTAVNVAGVESPLSNIGDKTVL